MSWPLLFLTTSICLLLEAFFAGSELALVSADKLKLNHLSARGNRGARVALSLARRPEWFFSATLLGQNLFIVANTIFVTFFIFDRFGMEYEFFGILLSPLILVFGEAVPKSLFQQWADRLTPLVAPIVLLFSYIFYPVVWLLSRLTLLLMGGVQGSLLTGHQVTRESLEILLRDSEAPRELSPVFKESLLKTLAFAGKEAREVMTPLVEVFSLRDTTLVEEALALCHEEGFSSVPVFQKRAHNIVGTINYFHLLLARDPKVPVSSLMVPSLFVPSGMSVKEIFLLFRSRQVHFAVVVDEYGGAVGIVTLEDIVEEVLGEIQDEYDEEVVPWRQIGPVQYLLEGRAEIDQVNEKLKLGIPSGDYETVSGFLLSHFERIPETGEVVRFGHLTFLIKTATARSIEEVLVELG